VRSSYVHFYFIGLGIRLPFLVLLQMLTAISDFVLLTYLSHFSDTIRAGCGGRRKLLIFFTMFPYLISLGALFAPQNTIDEALHKLGSEDSNSILILFIKVAAFYLASLLSNYLLILHSSFGPELAGESTARRLLFKTETLFEIIVLLVSLTAPQFTQALMSSCTCPLCFDQNGHMDLNCAALCTSECFNQFHEEFLTYPALALGGLTLLFNLTFMCVYSEREESMKQEPLSLIPALERTKGASLKAVAYSVMEYSSFLLLLGFLH